MRPKLPPRLATVKDGTILLIGVSYLGQAHVFTYVLLKEAGLWYMTGSGKVPIAAGWGAVERWLGERDRQVEWLKVVTETRTIDGVDTSQS